MNNQLAALKADARRAPSAPVPSIHDQFQLAGLLAADRAADLQDARFDGCDLTGADFRGATTDFLTLIGCPADGADFRGAQGEEVAP